MREEHWHAILEQIERGHTLYAAAAIFACDRDEDDPSVMTRHTNGYAPAEIDEFMSLDDRAKNDVELSRAKALRTLEKQMIRKIKDADFKNAEKLIVKLASLHSDAYADRPKTQVNLNTGVDLEGSAERLITKIDLLAERYAFNDAAD